MKIDNCYITPVTLYFLYIVFGFEIQKVKDTFATMLNSIPPDKSLDYMM